MPGPEPSAVTPASVDQLVESMRRAEGKVTFFIGAGVSADPPSSLPLAVQWKQTVFEGIWERSTAATSLREYRQTIAARIWQIPTEVLFQIIEEVVPKKRFVEAFVHFGRREPNDNHRRIAQLVAEGYVSFLITTNFDCNLEQALTTCSVNPLVARTEQEFKARALRDALLCHEIVPFDTEMSSFSPIMGLYEQHSRRDLPRYSPKDVASFGSRKFTATRYVPVIKLHGCIDLPGTIVTTIQRVTTGLPTSFLHIVAPLLSATVVVVIGWSDADIDITPLFRCGTERETFWLLHGAPDQDIPKHIANLLGPRSVWGSISGVIRGESSRILEALTLRFTGRDASARKAVASQQWRQTVEAWCCSLTPHECDYILAELSRRAYLLDESLRITKSICGRRSLPKKLHAVAATAQSKILMERREWQKAERVLRIVRLSRRFSKATTARLELLEAACLGHTAREPEIGPKIHKLSEWAIQAQDYWVQSEVAFIMAQTEYVKENYPQAIILLNASEQGMGRSGNFEALVGMMRVLSYIRQDLGQFGRAEWTLRRATEFAELFGDTALGIEVLLARATMLARSQHLLKARDTFEEVRSESMNPLTVGLSTMNLGLTWCDEDPSKALELLIQAEKMLVPLELSHFTRLVYQNLERHCQKMGKFREAERYRSKLKQLI